MRHFKFDVPGGKFNYYDEEDWLHLPKRPNIYEHVSTGNLTSISLNLIAVGYMSRFMEMDGNGSMQSFLGSAPKLTDLSLTMDCRTDRGVVDLENLLGTYTWRSLSSIRFSGMGFLDDQLIDLISRHQGCLRLIELVFIGLTTREEYSKAPISQQFGLTSWEALLSSMESLDLEHLLIKSVWDCNTSPIHGGNRKSATRSWSCDKRDAIHDFLHFGRMVILPSLTVGFQSPEEREWSLNPHFIRFLGSAQ